MEAEFISPVRDWIGSVDQSIQLIFLGMDRDEQPYFAAKIKDEDGESLASAVQGEWKKARSVGGELSPGDAAILALAHGLVVFHEKHAFDSVSGSPSIPATAGFSRTNQDGKNSVYPRLDPAVMALVMCGDYCLLGSSQKWVEGRYSLLAGFCEIGETLEQAVQREVYEESGIEVDMLSIEYKASQPWPFPQSLMIGFAADIKQDSSQPELEGLDLVQGEARKAAIHSGITAEELTRYLQPSLPKPHPDLSELKDARWFYKEWIRAHINNNTHLVPDIRPFVFSVPASHSLARRIMHQVLDNQDPWKGDEIPDVDIDKGRFKYVLVRVTDADDRSKIVVKGSSKYSYHMESFQDVKARCIPRGLTAQALGGGRIEHYPEQKVIHIYGYSQAFGYAVHEVTAAILSRWYPFYEKDNIIVGYAGY